MEQQLQNTFSSNFKILAQKGYLEIAGVPSKKKATDNKIDNKSDRKTNEQKAKEEIENEKLSTKRQN